MKSKDWVERFDTNFPGEVITFEDNQARIETRLVTCDSLKDFIRAERQLLLDEVLGVVGEDDKQISGKDINDFKYPRAKIRNQLRAELRTKIKELGER